jgi:hypothetical protein
MGKLSALPPNSNPALADLLVMIQNATTTDQKVTLAAIQSLLLAAGTINKVFQQRTSNQTTSAPGSTSVAWNGFSGTYNFNAIVGKVYAISLNEPTLGTSGAGANFDLFIAVNINGTQVNQFHASMVSTGTGFALYDTVYWQAAATGSVALTLTMTNDGNPGGGFTMGASTNTPAQLVVNELS